MKFAYINDDHHLAGTKWKRSDLREWFIQVFEAPKVPISPGCTLEIRKHVESMLLSQGWALNVGLDQNYRLTIFAEKQGTAFQLQTGNVSRAPYDLLKLQYLFQKKRINLAVLALPTKETAKIIGSNLANSERVINELKLFYQVITVPIIVIAFN
ncbi:MAG: restriction endonuclease [Rhodobacteraceae bacterium]|nr:restriction endonuclease [Paracoccaceae bacterium]